MKRGLVWAAMVLSCAWLAGCGGGAAPEGEKKASADGQASAGSAGETTVEITPESTPDEVVTGLIEAMRSGDKEAKEALLTQKAREETAKHNMPVADNAMPNAEYQVAKPKYLQRNPNGAHVSCVLSETLQDGSTEEYEIVWVLRKEPEIGWRIAGMAVELLPDTEPQFLNFEDPLDMQKKMEAAATVLAQQEQEAMAANEDAGADPAAEERQEEPETTQATKLNKLRQR